MTPGISSTSAARLRSPPFGTKASLVPCVQPIEGAADILESGLPQRLERLLFRGRAGQRPRRRSDPLRRLAKELGVMALDPGK